MNQLKTATVCVLLIVISVLLISCSTAAESPTPTAVPTSSPEASTDSESLSESQVPRGAIQVPRITAQELKERLDSGEAIVIADSRSANAYEIRHIAGAISVPESEVESHLDELPLDQEIVFYCV